MQGIYRHIPWRLRRLIGRGLAEPESAPYQHRRINLDAENGGLDFGAKQIVNLLNYTKTSGSMYGAAQYESGYHTLELNGRELKGQRNPSARLRDVPYDFTGKLVLDIGCNQGGMLFELQGKVRFGVGLDYDYRMINAANRIRAYKNANNLSFYVFDLEKEDLNIVCDFLPAPRVDIVFLLSVCMWISNWQQVIRFASTLSDHLLFETNGSDEQQLDQERFLSKHYTTVRLVADRSEDDPGQKNRKLLLCER